MRQTTLTASATHIRGTYSCFFVWDTAALDYQSQLSTLGGGGIFRMDLPDYSGYIVAERLADTLYIKESSFSPDQLDTVAEHALQKLGGARCIVRYPAPVPRGASRQHQRPFALLSNYSVSQPLSDTYLGLVLD